MSAQSVGLVGAIQARCNELHEEYIPAYRAVGPAGMFAVALMQRSVEAAERAVAEGDVVAMVRLLQELRGYKL